jgi:hypothetical protein
MDAIRRQFVAHGSLPCERVKQGYDETEIDSYLANAR